MGTVENRLPVGEDLRTRAPALALTKPAKVLGG